MIYLEPSTSDELGRRFSRLRGDDTDDLDRFVTEAGIRRAVLVTHPSVAFLTHYEIDAKDRRRAVRAGAVEADWSDIQRRLSRALIYGQAPETDRDADEAASGSDREIIITPSPIGTAPNPVAATRGAERTRFVKGVLRRSMVTTTAPARSARPSAPY